MTNLWNALASAVELFAYWGAGAASWNLKYEPKLPVELQR